VVRVRNYDVLKKFIHNLRNEFKKPEILDFDPVYTQKNYLNMFTMVEATSSFYEIVLKNEVIPIEAKIVNGEEYWTLFTRKDRLSKVLQRISDKSLRIDDYRFEIESITNLTSFRSNILSRIFGGRDKRIDNQAEGDSDESLQRRILQVAEGQND